MNLRLIFKYKVLILTFLLVVSYHTYKLIELNKWLLLFDIIATGIFLVFVVYTGRKVFNQSFLTMLSSNLRFIISCTL